MSLAYRRDPGAMAPEARLEEAAALLLRGALRLLHGDGAPCAKQVQDPQNRLDEAPRSERTCDPAVDAAANPSKEVA